MRQPSSRMGDRLRPAALGAIGLVSLACTAGAALPTEAKSIDDAKSIDVTACEMWRDHVSFVAEWLDRSGALHRVDAPVVHETIAKLGARCSTDDPRRIIRMFRQLEDLLGEED